MVSDHEMENIMADDGTNAGGADNAGTGTSGDGATGTTGETGKATTGDGTGTGDGTTSTTATETVSKAEFDALMERMKAADRRAGKAEADKKALEDAGKTDAEKIAARNAELEAEVAKTKADVRRTKLENAFLSDATVWNNSADAFELLLANHGDGVEVDKDGKVTGMDVAIKALAKSRAYLVKTESGTTEATGSEHNGTRKGAKSEAEVVAEKAARARRFPAAFNNATPI